MRLEHVIGMSLVQKLSLTDTVHFCIAPLELHSSCSGLAACGGARAISVRHGSNEELEAWLGASWRVYFDDGVGVDDVPLVLAYDLWSADKCRRVDGPAMELLVSA